MPSFGGSLSAIRPFQAAYDAYLARGVVRTLNARDPEWGGEEPWREPHYYAVGEDALRIVVEALALSGRELPRRVLDFPCGSGRVTRHLRAFLPDAHIWASDIDPGHVRFCAEHFGTHAHQSSADLSTVRFDAEFDLIFCGSLLTHLPEAQSRAALSLIARALGPAGIAVVTLHGRHALHTQHHTWKYMSDEAFAVAERGMRESGYGFAPYGPSEGPFQTSAEYGVSVASPSWTLRQLEGDPSIRVLSYREREWDDHQDVVVFGRPGVNA